MEKKNKSVRSKRSLPTDPEKALRQSEKRYKAIVETSLDGIYQVDASGKLIFVNDSLAKIFGYKREELLGKHFSSLLGAETSRKVKEMMGQVLSGENVRDEVPVQHKDGHEALVSFGATPLKSNGKIIGLTGILRDITERKRAEQKLRIGEERLDSFMNSSPESFLLFDSGLNLVDLNKVALDRWGINKEDVVGKNMLELLPGIEKKGRYKKYKAVLDTGETFELEEYVPDPSFGYAERCISLKAFKMGDSLGLIASDITERKKAEEALKGSEEKYRAVVDTAGKAGEGIAIVQDVDGREAAFVFANDEFCIMVGYSREELLSMKAQDVINPDEFREILDRYRRRQRREDVPSLYQLTFIRKDGTTVPIEAGFGVTTYSGKVATVAFLRDITERKWGEKQRALSLQLLETLNRGGELRQLIRDILMLMKESSGFEAVGIRINAGEDFPYYETNGFAEDFVGSESRLCVYGLNGQLLRDEIGNPLLECMCGNIICGRFDPQKPFFTHGGSFWTNSTTELLASTSEADRQARTRNRCNGEGYESVALIPLKSEGTTVGLLQLNDKRRDRFTQQLVEYYEGIGQSIGILLARKRAEEALKRSEALLKETGKMAKVGGWEFDVETLKQVWTEETYRIHEVDMTYSPTVEKGIAFYAPAARPIIERAVQRAIEYGEPFGVELEFITAKGNHRWVHAIGKAHQEHGKIRRVSGTFQDVTERKKAEEALRQSEARFRAVFEGASITIALVNMRGRILEWNKSAQRLFGYSLEELGKMSLLDVVYPEDATLDVALWGELKAGKRDNYNVEKRYLRKSGEVLRIRQYLSLIRDADGKPEYTIAMAEDITERKRAEEALRCSEEHLRALVENSHEAIVVLKGDGTISYGTPGIEQMLGYTSEDLLDTGGFGFAHPDDMPKVMESFAHLMEDPSSIVRIELRVQHKDGSWKVVEAVARNLLENKAVEGIVINWRDITERKKAEEELRRLSDAVRMSTDSIVVTDMRGNILDGNEASVKIYGAVDRADLFGTKAFDIISPEGREKAFEKMKAVMEKGYVSGLEYHVLTKDGRKILVEASTAIMRGSKGEPVGFVGVSRDITERKRVEEELGRYQRHLEELVEERTTNLKNSNEILRYEIAERQQAEEALRASEERFRNIVESIPIPVVISRMSDGALLYGNRQFVLITGISLEELTGHKIWDFYDSPTRREDILNHLLRDAYIAEHEFRGKKADGTTFRAMASVRLLKFEGCDAVLMAFNDITARKKAEEERESLYQMERNLRRQLEEEMKKRVEFTRTLAHELKTPLTPVMLSSQELVAMLKDETSLRLAKNISRGASNLSSRIDELLDLAKGEIGMLKLKRDYIDVLKLLQEVVEEVSAVPRSRGQKLIWEPPASLPQVWADQVRVRQIVMNLLNNAFKFTPRQGQITIRANGEEGNVVIEVSDTGPGIKEEDQGRLFNPYHRLEGDREQLSGLGLGLALCKTLAELHGGQIWLKSSPGKGSTFGFSLPLGAHE